MPLTSSIIIILGVAVLSMAGLASVLSDLIGCGPHEAPVFEDDALQLRSSGKAKPRSANSPAHTESGIRL